MKAIHILFAAAALALAACGDDPAEQLEVKLDATPTTLRFAAEAAPVQTVTVTTENTDWEAEQSLLGGWLTLDRDGNILMVSAADNTKETSRSAEITISPTAGGIAPVTIKVSQDGAEPVETEEPSLSISAERLDFTAEGAPGQEVVVTATGGITWQASPAENEEWIHIAAEEDRFTVTVDDNPVTLERNGYINVSPSDKSIRTVRLYIVQEAKILPASLEPELPDGATPEEGITVPYTAGTTVLKVSVLPEDAKWSVSVEKDGEADDTWLSATNVAVPSQHTLFADYKANEMEETRTAYLVLTHSDSSVEPVRVKVTQQGKADVNSTIFTDIDLHPTNLKAEVMANNNYRDFPFIQWTLTFYTEGITYDSLWRRWGGTGERIKILMTGSPQQEDEVALEEMTYEIVPYDEYNKQPANERKPGWVCGTQGTGTGEYPKGTWLQVYDNDTITECANAASGSVTVVRNGDEYTISWDFMSDAGYKITGSYTGPVEPSLH